jgi:hypothetical protein
LTPFNKSSFKFEWEAYHEGGHYMKIKRTWINPDTLSSEEAISEMFKDWTLIRKEGEELPPPVAEVAPAGGKGAPPAKKPDDKKKAPPPGKKGGIEVVADNNP